MLTVEEVLNQASVDLQDEDNVRWPRSDLLVYFNSGQRALAQMRPDQVAEERDLELSDGWRHDIGDDVLHLLQVTNNTPGRMSAVTKIDTWVLDAVSSNWRSGRPSDVVVHYMHSLTHPSEMQVYPPVIAGTKLRIVVAADPTELTDESQLPSVPVRWLDALLHYVLYRAWSKDAEFAANAELAASHLQLFNAALGAQAQTASATEPTT